MAVPENSKFGIFHRSDLNQAAGITELPDKLNVDINPYHGGFNGGFLIELDLKRLEVT